MAANSATTDASSRLLSRAYVTIEAKVCGPLAIDRESGTTDFLTLLDPSALAALCVRISPMKSDSVS